MNNKRYFKRLLTTTLLISFFIFTGGQAFAVGLTLLYSGTFDPFHRVHLQEVEGALNEMSNEFPGSTALIMPIQRAPHTPFIPETNSYQPTFLNYQEIIELAQASIEHNPNISLDLNFQILTGPNSGIAQSEATKNVNTNNQKAHLIGTDILAVWEKKGFVELILDTAMIVVSADPSDLKTFEMQKAKYGAHPKMRFINVVTESVRSTDIRLKSLSDDPKAWAEFLAPGARKKIKTQELKIEPSGANYLNKMRKFAKEFFAFKILPALYNAHFDERILNEILRSEAQQIQFMNLLYERLVAGKPGKEFLFPFLDAEKIKKLDSLSTHQSLKNSLTDAARTLKALRVSPSSQQNSCYKVFNFR